ncbi:hypothetical protein DU53_06920 [Kosmotoga sp. DU53]|nr:hypothetical protein DU53_06920 [Kosmotoga sp. DU53]
MTLTRLGLADADKKPRTESPRRREPRGPLRGDTNPFGIDTTGFAGDTNSYGVDPNCCAVDTHLRRKAATL